MKHNVSIEFCDLDLFRIKIISEVSILSDFFFTLFHVRILADVAERLRRLTRNQFPSGSVGSIPTVCDCATFESILFNFLQFPITLHLPLLAGVK